MRKLIFYIAIFGVPFCLKAQSSVSATQSVNTAWGFYVKTGIAAYGNTLLQITMDGQNSTWHGLFAVNSTNSWTPNLTWNNVSLLSWSGYNSTADDIQVLIMSNIPANSFGGTEIVIKIGSPTSGSGSLSITATGENASQLSMSSYSYSPLSYTMASSQGTYNIYQNNNKVGIGTTSPQTLLDVAGVVRTTNGSYATWDNMQLWSDGENSYIQSNGDEKGLHIKSNVANKIYLESNVSIGTSDPGQYKLAVDGILGARKIKVTQASWSDYVFNDGYHLRPLSQVENFIKENKHLPEVPTAKEVERNGVDVGETQALLLKKIEELTLYMIEMKKENDNLKNRIIKLEQDAKKP